ncbi:hypothetical protein EV126DRAFT_184326 [Verticillium dahliae]|nr:hypothetical protein EV126DRAFT_184326 [Verticillium dahliae]
MELGTERWMERPRASMRRLESCLASACSTDAAAYSSYTSRSASECSRWSTCSTTGTYTYSYDSEWWDWATPTATVVTVTGCPWNRGPGWRYETDTVTVTVTDGGSASGTPVLSTIVVAAAVSGDETVRTTFGLAAATGTDGNDVNDDNNSAAPGGDDLRGVKAALVCLAAVVVGVGLL